jgi:hypothetical protein
MTAGVRVAAFAALLAAIFALAALAGRVLDPAADAGAPAHGAGSGMHAQDAHGAGSGSGMHAMHTHDAAPAAAGDGLRLVAVRTTLPAGAAATLTFRIVDAHGATLRAFETEQARRMHLIVVRRDLRRFQHLHPTQDASGAWTTRITLPTAGVYHAFADFQTAGARQTVGADLFAAGRFEPLELPAPSTRARVDGYDVTLRERAGESELRFTVRRGGVPVGDLQPYLGARGHLVMLRAGDLAYEHVHPLAGPAALAFATGDTAPGTYRLFLQFRHGDTVHTAAFTREVTR